ncbi:uncharacterized protein LOC128201793 isoform X2 [Galleria mellonella]|uniref:Uncharacterized protein LOC128201793 isoform X2 n=1 Tax=Galleria mellonella TaxID=7137 RepID=A0ABM3MWK3_GALME|nr:uncharacterized protein LOC128201793 isoform X2 [Galleria mellonella]
MKSNLCHYPIVQAHFIISHASLMDFRYKRICSCSFLKSTEDFTINGSLSVNLSIWGNLPYFSLPACYWSLRRLQPMITPHRPQTVAPQLPSPSPTPLQIHLRFPITATKGIPTTASQIVADK